MGICGTAMSSLAGLLQARGYQISGSDQKFYPPASIELKSRKIKTFTGYREENIHAHLDLVIVGNVISRRMPECQALMKKGVPYISLTDAVNQILIKDKVCPIMITGTHGKTTASFLAAWVLDQCKTNPSFIIGGVDQVFRSGYRDTDSPYVVLEGDEYDTAFFDKNPKFLNYRPQFVLLTSIEWDHCGYLS